MSPDPNKSAELTFPYENHRRILSKMTKSDSTRTSHSIPWPDVAAPIRKTMAANKGKNTKPEVELRSLLHLLGYRFRIHGRELPGTPDVVFSARRKVIWLHGCFWHSHPGCRFATKPKTRADFWEAKLARNVERDAEHEERLRQMGWQSLVVWECDLQDKTTLRSCVQGFLGSPRLSRA
jgi:DNA mismatch endonuclease, patch repair protein